MVNTPQGAEHTQTHNGEALVTPTTKPWTPATDITWCSTTATLGEAVEVWTTDTDAEQILLEITDKARGRCLNAHLSPEAARIVGRALIAAAERALVRRIAP